jgi:signal transduction histidine kinase/CheY-like chemotaxis protein
MRVWQLQSGGPPAEPGTWAAEMRELLAQVRDSTFTLALPLLGAAALVAVSASGLPDLTKAALCATALLWLGGLAWLLRSRSPGVAGWLLVIGWSVIIIALAAWAGMSAALWLLSFSGGLAVLLLGTRAGVGVAAILTLTLIAAPEAWFTVGPVAGRVVSILGVWGMVAITWLAMRPLQIVGEWAWAAYGRSQQLLDDAQDTQLRLNQMLDDLTSANTRLVRLNRLADGLRQEAEEARRAKEQFVANVSHELRTPLNMIIGFSEMILNAPQAYGASSSGGRLPPALLADLAVILRNARHLASLIDDVLDLSQIEAGQMALVRERVALSEVVEEALVAVRPLFESKGLALCADLEDGLPEVSGDRTRVREVLLNLLSNAGRFTEEGGVTVMARRRDGELLVSVTDTGPGIAVADQSRLFQPFQQLDTSLRRRFGGTGLGLSISQRFVEMHGGRMWVESAPGAGAAFRFTLPIEPLVPAARGAGRWLTPSWEYLERTHPSLAPVPPARPEIVVCETGGSLAHLLTRYLQDARVTSVADLTEALALAASLRAHAVVVNASSAAEMLAQLESGSALPEGVPVMVCSVPGAPDAAGNLGVADYLVKPVARETLLLSLDKLGMDGKKVLVADDDEDALRLFYRMLTSAGRGYRVLTAPDGRQAWAMLKDERPDVLLTDLVMPEMDGFELLAAKNSDPTLAGIPAVVLSARDPQGQPIVSKAFAVTGGAGLSLVQLLAGITTLSRAFGPAPPAGDLASPATPPD